MNARKLIAAVACVTLLALPTLAQAAELPAQSRGEIEYLLSRLGSSECEFNRNGSWYSATEAREHLTKKFNYLANRNALKSSEDFIELGASRSSMSGKAYQVKCGNSAAVDSALWLAEALRRYRREQGAR